MGSESAGRVAEKTPPICSSEAPSPERICIVAVCSRLGGSRPYVLTVGQSCLCGDVGRGIEGLMAPWDACRHGFHPSKLKGGACYRCLDLISTTDTTMFVQVFPPIEVDAPYFVLLRF